jgi:hypothetical protein
VKDREVIANNLKKAGWSHGCVSAIDSNGRTSASMTVSGRTTRPSK